VHCRASNLEDGGSRSNKEALLQHDSQLRLAAAASTSPPASSAREAATAAGVGVSEDAAATLSTLSNVLVAAAASIASKEAIDTGDVARDMSDSSGRALDAASSSALSEPAAHEPTVAAKLLHHTPAAVRDLQQQHIHAVPVIPAVGTTEALAAQVSLAAPQRAQL
jgi:hypothetical protein